ncbi:TetR/AcrR family transcriptional regulator [Kribbella solani]|uniref:TetR/AcrR family transcriptional regulator n=1 Tax=Kribbella solani TaxID=236067 RepID=UPI0029B00970|nr:TetR/AcrR family transcriptional regulator [Kribbella solani]MDX3006605.1 TetR/AcrR family transcriptional regulator [Kribbella solani]
MTTNCCHHARSDRHHRRSFAGTSIGEVARRAGVSKGVVTYHFPTKDALLKQVVVELYERAGSQIAAATSVDATPSTGTDLGTPAVAAGSSLSWRILHGYITSNLKFVAENRRHVRAAMEVLGNLRAADGSLEFAPNGPDPVTAHLEGLLRDGIQRGDFAKVDPAAMAVAIRSVIDTTAARGGGGPNLRSSRPDRHAPDNRRPHVGGSPMSTTPENTAVRAPEPTGSRRTKAAFVTGLTPLVRRRAITRCPFLAPRVPHYGVRLPEPGSAAPQTGLGSAWPTPAGAGCTRGGAGYVG